MTRICRGYNVTFYYLDMIGIKRGKREDIKP